MLGLCHRESQRKCSGSNMADLSQSIRAFILTQVSGVHVGETVPQSVATSFVWFQRQGDILDDSLKHPTTIEAVLFDFECVSEDINECRTLTELVKSALMNSDLHFVTFTNSNGLEQTIHAFDVEDHDDNYLPHTLEQDSKLHIGAFRVTAHFGQLVK